MHSRNITIDTITKIEGNAGLKIIIEDDAVKDLQFIISDYRRFFTTAVRGRRVVAVPSFLSRICGTCSVAHLFASLMAIESAQGITVTKQTRALRRDRKSTRLNSSHANISYAVFCLKKKKKLSQ